MSLKEATYAIPPRGLATSFEESELPPDFALRFRNRFINAAGGAEKRQGITQKGSTISGGPNLTGNHELVKSDGTTVVFVSGQGAIYRFDTPSWTSVHSGLSSSAIIRSVQMGKKLIFYNGVDPTIFTEDGTTFESLNAIIEAGQSTSGSSSVSLRDETNQTNWVSLSQTAVNDLVYNRTLSGYGVITAVATASVAHTTISSAATGIGIVDGSAKVGDFYEIIDLVELNIIPTAGEDDNTATAGVGTSTTSIVVSAVADWTTTELQIGDYIRNTTRTAITQVTAIATASIGVHGVASQQSGDALIFLKHAMPIAEKTHIHFGRAYHIDARDRRFIRISGPNNPNDMTADSGTLDTQTFNFGDLQPAGDAAVSMGSFQRFFAVAGRSNIFLYSGTDPIQDTSAATTDFSIVGLFPHGAVSKDSVVSLGNDLAFISDDGVQAVSLVSDASTLGRANISDPIKTTLRDGIKNNPASEILAFHYPRRSWLCIKIGTEIYVYNYTPYYGDEKTRTSSRGEILSTKDGSWSLFDGKFAQQNAYFVRRDGTLQCCGAGGKVYEFDKGDYADDGTTYTTELESGWQTLDEPKKRVNIKAIKYLKAILDAGAAISYTFRLESDFGAVSTQTVTVTADKSNAIGVSVIGTNKIGGAGIDNIKFPLRGRGEQFRLNITTADQLGPDVISRYTYYATKHGKR